MPSTLAAFPSGEHATQAKGTVPLEWTVSQRDSAHPIDGMMSFDTKHPFLPSINVIIHFMVILQDVNWNHQGGMNSKASTTFS
jgi:hypothetical protein